MSSVFREIAIRNEGGKSDRLFRAAVSAFTSLTRPSRREIGQLAQLTLPLFDRTSTDARRYVCAVLSDSPHAPVELVQRLCEEPVETCAPLLIRSPLLSNADLVRIIGAKGAPHARVIARRGDLHPALAALATALARAAAQSEALAERSGETGHAPSSTTSDGARRRATTDVGTAEAIVPEAVRDAAEAVRRDLRAIMAGQRPPRRAGPRSAERLAHEDDYQRLKATLLSGGALTFREALSQALGIGAETARSIAASRSYDDLIAAFRHIDLSEEEAFLLVCAACPERFSRTSAIRLFLERYRAFSAAAATGIVLAWRADRLSPRATPSHGSEASVHALPPRGDVKAS